MASSRGEAMAQVLVMHVAGRRHHHRVHTDKVARE